MGIRTLLVDDSPFVLDSLVRILDEAGGFEVVGTAHHGLEALEQAEARRPDVVSLDVQMPVMNGLQTLKQLMTRRPVPTLMVSALTAEESPITFECLRLGAVDFVEKLSGADGRALLLQRREIVERLRRAAAVDVRRIRCVRMRRPGPNARETPSAPPRRVVVAGVGRAGLAPLLRILNGFPSGLGTSFIVSCGLGDAVLRPLATWACGYAGIDVVAPSGATPLSADTAYLVPSARAAMVLEEDGARVLVPYDPPAGADPERASEFLFASVAERFGKRSAGLLLAGAGTGCLPGLRHVLEHGGSTFCQSPESAVDSAALTRARDQGLGLRIGEPDALLEAMVTRLLQEG